MRLHHDGIPVAPINEIVFLGGTTPVCYINCPYCGKVHQHGYPRGDDRLSHRGSHCGESKKDGRGYYLAIDEHTIGVKQWQKTK